MAIYVKGQQALVFRRNDYVIELDYFTANIIFETILPSSCFSTFNRIHSQPSHRSFFIFFLHICTCVTHGANDFIQRNKVFPITP